MRAQGQVGGGSYFAIILFVLVLAVAITLSGIHKIHEGHIGVYWRGGALLKETTDPGFHFKVPTITTFAQIQVTLQTDIVTNIPCGTSGGVIIYFEKIEVVNRLKKEFAHATLKEYGPDYDRIWIFDKIHHEINQFCSSHTLQEVYIDMFELLDESLAKALQADCNKWNTGIEIVAIRVTKPKIPVSVLRNYEAVEEQKTRLMVAAQQQLVIKKQEETDRIRATIHAQKEAEVAEINAMREANVSKIEITKQILQKEGDFKKAEIENQIYQEKQKALADAYFYEKTREAEANSVILTPQYLQLTLLKSLSNNTKIFFGEKIPQIYIDFENFLNSKPFGSSPPANLKN